MITREHFNTHWAPLVERVRKSNSVNSALTQAIIGEIMKSSKDELIANLKHNRLMEEE